MEKYRVSEAFERCGMKRKRVHQEGNESPSFLRVPTPVASGKRSVSGTQCFQIFRLLYVIACYNKHFYVYLHIIIYNYG